MSAREIPRTDLMRQQAPGRLREHPPERAIELWNQGVDWTQQ